MFANLLVLKDLNVLPLFAKFNSMAADTVYKSTTEFNSG